MPTRDPEQLLAETELLYQLTAACNEIAELAPIHELALTAVTRGTHCDRAAILLFDADRVMRFVASRGLSATYRAAVEGHSPWTANASAPQSVLVADTEADPAWAAYREAFRAEGVRSLAFVPLVHHGVLLGKFMLYREEPRAFSAAEIRLAQAISTHVAQSVVRVQREEELARLYRFEREAHHLAEEATRAREEILSVVSHDLRNPLGTILIGSSTLADSADPRVAAVGARIQRQAVRMARLIEDLVDFAGIEAGRLAITRAPQAPASMIETTRELFRQQANERGLQLEASAVSPLPVVDCDAERVVQIFGNLVGNALKVTPRGGSIEIGAQPENDDVVFFVRDTGPGIAPDELPSLFQRHWRSKHAHYKGAGLGLSIARGIVEAHGGRIWAESQLGRGSTFFFSLTSTRN